MTPSCHGKESPAIPGRFILSLLWGAVGIAAWYHIIRALTREPYIALLPAVFVGLDYTYTRAAADIRFDMQAAALGWAAIAVYLHLRRQNLPRAILAASSLMTMSLFTHPNAVGLFVVLCASAVVLDRHHMRAGHVLLAAAPCALAVALWGWYIMQDVQAFREQLFGNATGRVNTEGGVVGMLWREIEQRYVSVYVTNESLSGAARLKGLLLLGYLLAPALVLGSRGARASAVGRFLLCGAGVVFVMLLLIDGYKNPLYLIYQVPFLVAMLGLCVARAWQALEPGHVVRRAIIVAGVAAWIGLNCVGSALIARRDEYHRLFLPMIAYLNNQLADSPGLILGPPELQFGLGFGSAVLDDTRLGYHSHKRPMWIVRDKRYSQWEADFARDNPPIAAHVMRLLDEEYALVFRNAKYEVFRKHD